MGIDFFIDFFPSIHQETATQNLMQMAIPNQNIHEAMCLSLASAKPIRSMKPLKANISTSLSAAWTSRER